ncbi:hypothetical protein BKA81DRAFT_152643 [Phyllosticta paracitricarpa]
MLQTKTGQIFWRKTLLFDQSTSNHCVCQDANGCPSYHRRQKLPGLRNTPDLTGRASGQAEWRSRRSKFNLPAESRKSGSTIHIMFVSIETELQPFTSKPVPGGHEQCPGAIKVPALKKGTEERPLACIFHLIRLYYLVQTVQQNAGRLIRIRPAIDNHVAA